MRCICCLPVKQSVECSLGLGFLPRHGLDVLFHSIRTCIFQTHHQVTFLTAEVTSPTLALVLGSALAPWQWRRRDGLLGCGHERPPLASPGSSSWVPAFVAATHSRGLCGHSAALMTGANSITDTPNFVILSPRQGHGPEQATGWFHQACPVL